MSGAASLLKRGTPSAWPHELTVATEGPLSDPERIDLPVTDERILNFANRGQIQPISVKPMGDDLVVVAGRQRWKRATVINHLVGAHAYTGKIDSVKEAIDRLKTSAAGKRVIDLCPRGMKLYFVVHRGTELEAARDVTSENAHRDDDPMGTKIKRAKRQAALGFSAEELAEDAGVSVASIKRWLSVDLDKPRGKKTRGPAILPSKKRIAAVLANGVSKSELSPREAILLRFSIEGTKAEGFVENFPELSKALESGT